MKVWIVQGRTGEYSDCSSWIIKVFASERAAATFEKALLAEAITAGISSTLRGGRMLSDYYDKVNPLDPEHTSDYTGISYFTQSAEFEEAE